MQLLHYEDWSTPSTRRGRFMSHDAFVMRSRFSRLMGRKAVVLFSFSFPNAAAPRSLNLVTRPLRFRRSAPLFKGWTSNVIKLLCEDRAFRAHSFCANDLFSAFGHSRPMEVPVGGGDGRESLRCDTVRRPCKSSVMKLSGFWRHGVERTARQPLRTRLCKTIYALSRLAALCERRAMADARAQAVAAYTAKVRDVGKGRTKHGARVSRSCVEPSSRNVGYNLVGMFLLPSFPIARSKSTGMRTRR